MQTTKKKPSLIFILVGAVLAGYLGYLINGAWTEGIAFNEFMDRFNEVCAVPFANYYNSNTVKAVAIAMDGLREDDEVIDAEYREVEPEEAESEIDDYAIPDEPESYASNRDYVSAKGMTPQETADEDRMVTQAEYGAEIEAETTEKDPSELQYITPIDYAKRIAELDEDLRDAAEILVTDCSCYTPFRAYAEPKDCNSQGQD